MVNAMTGLDDGGDTEGLPPAQPTMGPCILVVDDSPAIRRIVTRALTDARYTVLEAEDGVLALELLERGDVDIALVLTDIRMPRLDGIELGRRIADRRWRVPVLYMSGSTGDAVADSAGHPVAPLLRKPFSMGTLVGIVDRVLLGRRAGHTAVEECSAPTWSALRLLHDPFRAESLSRDGASARVV
jgi:CheY-like chemotaxis protein